METTRNFNFETIIAQIKSANVEKLYAVSVKSHPVNDDVNCDEGFYFAGTTTEEAKYVMDEVEKTIKPEFGTEYDIDLMECTADALPLDDYDPDCDDAEMAIEDATTGEWGFACVNEANEWASRTVEYPYETLKGSIVVYWRWETHVGYAMKYQELELMIVNETERICVEKDSVTSRQISVLLRPNAIKACASREELTEKIAHELATFKGGKWRNLSNTGGYGTKTYEDAAKELLEELYGRGYYAPYLPEE